MCYKIHEFSLQLLAERLRDSLEAVMAIASFFYPRKVDTHGLTPEVFSIFIDKKTAEVLFFHHTSAALYSIS